VIDKEEYIHDEKGLGFTGHEVEIGARGVSHNEEHSVVEGVRMSRNLSESA